MRLELTHTTAGAVRTELNRASQRLGGLILNLVIVTDEAGQHDAVQAASEASWQHPCRVLGVIARNGRAESRLDADITAGENSPGQFAVLRLYGELSEHADSVILPLLVPDTPVVTWWPEAGPVAPAADPLGALAQRRITDAAAVPDPMATLAELAISYRPGDTDLAWTRTTPWRSLLAATLDLPHGPIWSGVVGAEAGNPSARLIAAWLANRLRVPVAEEVSEGPGITSVSFETPDGPITIARPDGRNATLSRPGEPERYVALHRREMADLLAEELRRLDPDEIYGETLARLELANAGRS